MTRAAPGSHRGERIDAERWVQRLRELGHRASAERTLTGGADLVIYQHAEAAMSHAAPCVPWRIVVSHDADAEQMSVPLRERVWVVPPSAEQTSTDRPFDRDPFQVCVLAHLSADKNPLYAAAAARFLPLSSRIQIVHAGIALEREMREEAQQEEGKNPRYRWLGDLPRSEALRLLARSRLLCGPAGANAIAEAIAAGVPIVTPRMAMTVELLGDRYPGLVNPRDPYALATMLYRVETDSDFYGEVKAACERLKACVDPARERAVWRSLLAETIKSGD